MEIRLALLDFRVPMDILVTTPEDFAWRTGTSSAPVEWHRTPGKARCSMPASEAVLTVVREWIVKADHDLTAAAQILKLALARRVRREVRRKLPKAALPKQKT